MRSPERKSTARRARVADTGRRATRAGGAERLHIGDLRRSSAHYGWALDLHAPRGPEWWTRVALDFEILGRSEFAALREPTSVSGRHATASGTTDLPYLGFEPRRRVYADAAFGLRVQLVESMVLSLGVFKSLNASGVRPEDWSPVAAIEGTF
jgi:hypothetical protein